MKTRELLPLAAALLLGAAVRAGAAEWRPIEDAEWCESTDEWCEVREIVLEGARDPIRVESSNGGIAVAGWDGDGIRVRAKVVVHGADSDEEAARLAREIRIDTDGKIEPDGPRKRGRRGPRWSVSFRLMVPRSANLDLDSSNGGISIRDVRGDIDFSTSNGGIRLANLGGDVRGRTTNGGVHVELAGRTWEGDGLDVRTTNGGVTFEIPERYSAELSAETTNGAIRSEFPLPGRRDGPERPRRVELTLGEGGPPLRVITTNGGVTIRRT